MEEEHRIAEEFWGIYEREWKFARDSLKASKHDEEIIYFLMRIVRSAYDFCGEAVKARRSRLAPDQVAKDFIDQGLHMSIHKEHITEDQVGSFVHHVISCLLEMCSKKHNLSIRWTPKGDLIDPETFVCEGQEKGRVCEWTVWPAVVTGDNHCLRKGVVIPV